MGSVVPGVGTALGASLGSGLGSGLAKGVETGNPLAGLGAGALGAAGSYAGSTLLGPVLGSLGSSISPQSGAVVPGFLGSKVGDTFGKFAGNAFGDATFGGLAGSAIGSSVGSSTGANIGSQLNPMAPDGPAGPTPFQPSRAGQMGLPQSLSQFGGLDPMQQASNIATRGVYGQGNGPQESSYFTNLINRQLVDDQGHVGDTSSINPVENSYLSQLGLGGYGNSTDLLKKISQYAA